MRTHFHALVILLALLPMARAWSDPRASLPDLRGEEIAKTIAKHQIDDQKLHVQYTLIYGTTDRTNPYNSQFVHTTDHYKITAEISIDHGSGWQRLSEDATISGSRVIFDYSYDRTVSRKHSTIYAKDGGGVVDRYGEVTYDKLPHLVTTKAHHPRAGNITFWGTPAPDIATALRSASTSTVSKEMVDSIPTYRIVFDVIRPRRFDEVTETVRYYVAQQFDMLPV